MYSCTSAKVGLVTSDVTPNPRQMARTSVVLPAPRSPRIATHSGGCAASPNSLPQCSSSGRVRARCPRRASGGTIGPRTRSASRADVGDERAADAAALARLELEQLIAQAGGSFEVERGRRLPHLPFEQRDHLLRLETGTIAGLLLGD